MLRISFLGTLFVMLCLFVTQGVYAVPNGVTGSATASNTGGLFDFTNHSSSVTIEPTTGEFGGYVWSEDVGWCEFGDEEGPASVSLVDGAVTGRVYCTNTGGYLDFDGYNSNVRMNLATGVFSGYAWSEDVGWVDFGTPGVTGPSLIYVVIDNTLHTEESVESNIGEIPDPSSATGLYFEKEGFGKIEFGATLDLTNPTVIAWLQGLGTKLDLAIQNRIGLDADLVQELIDTQATLTMYNVDLNDPLILVDGEEDTSGIVSHLVYDREAHTLTFHVAHFTTFTAIENTGSTTGKAPVSEIRGRLFCDVNGNSSWDSETEYPLKKVTVLITNLSEDTTHTVETDDTGTYSFGTPGSGKYRVMIDTGDSDNTCGTKITTEGRGGSLVQFVDSLSQQIIFAHDVGVTSSSSPTSSSPASSYPGMPKTGRG